MAGDWIKMRADLFTHPKVVRISSALKADVLRTVGGLMSAWCLFDAHSIDGSLPGYTSQTLDDHLRWPGFSAAMIAVGWLVDDGQSLVLPEFEAHNGQSAKRRAQGADRKQAVRKASASEADKKRTREEKRREEQQEQKQEGAGKPPPVVLPEWLPADVWQDWHRYRNARKGWTAHARSLSLKRLAELRDQGHDPRTVVDLAIESGWTKLWPPKTAGSPRAANSGPSKHLGGVASIFGVNPHDQATRPRTDLVLAGDPDGPGEPVRALPGRVAGG